jgi:hypothetical protein
VRSAGYFAFVFIFLSASYVFADTAAPQSTPEVRAETIYGLTFQKNNSAIPTVAFGKMGRLTDIIGAYLDNKEIPSIEITGYTDSIGAAEHNVKLSWARAISVMKYILDKYKDKGLKVSDFTIKGAGAAGFICDNSTDEGKSRNRRIEVVITGRTLVTKVMMVETDGKGETPIVETPPEAAPAGNEFCWKCLGLFTLDAGLTVYAAYEIAGSKSGETAGAWLAGAALAYTAADYFWLHTVFPVDVKPTVKAGNNYIDGAMITADIAF